MGARHYSITAALILLCAMPARAENICVPVSLVHTATSNEFWGAFYSYQQFPDTDGVTYCLLFAVPKTAWAAAGEARREWVLDRLRALHAGTVRLSVANLKAVIAAAAAQGITLIVVGPNDDRPALEAAVYLIASPHGDPMGLLAEWGITHENAGGGIP